MSEPFLAQISVWPYTFAPRGWAECDGELLSIYAYQALFAVIGTVYGGNGTSTFGLPDLRERVPIGRGSGAGLSPVVLGEVGGIDTISLNQQQIPSHNHLLQGVKDIASLTEGKDAFMGTTGAMSKNLYYTGDSQPSVILHESSLSESGSWVPHDNMQPYLCLRFCIALEGLYPNRY